MRPQEAPFWVTMFLGSKVRENNECLLFFVLFSRALLVGSYFGLAETLFSFAFNRNLHRQVTGRNYPPTNKNTHIRALTEELDKLPEQLLDNVVQSMVRRVECCITLHGGHIPC
ncbi:hypothetical protein TNCV_4899541 [Trichonephila clavipes]|nr:hypothetical protein TNCV_4899541 [Trichonephila clavipes]